MWLLEVGLESIKIALRPWAVTGGPPVSYISGVCRFYGFTVASRSSLVNILNFAVGRN